MLHTIEITTNEIRDAWAGMQEGRSPFSDRQDAAGVARHLRVGDYTGSAVSSFIGCSGEQMNQWLTSGYYVDASDLEIPAGTDEISVPSLDLVEEDGDLVISAAIAGDDLHRIRWEDLPAQRSVTIRAAFGMSAGTDASVLAEYTRWLLQLVDAYEAKGIAPTVELFCGSKGGFIGSKDDLMVTIPLVASGEIVDAVAWRAYLSPGSFRSLGFTALGIGADRANRKLQPGMGRPMTNSWGVTQEGDVVTVTCAAIGTSFPAAEMDRMVAAL